MGLFLRFGLDFMVLVLVGLLWFGFHVRLEV